MFQVEIATGVMTHGTEFFLTNDKDFRKIDPKHQRLPKLVFVNEIIGDREPLMTVEWQTQSRFTASKK